MEIPFNIPYQSGDEIGFIKDAIYRNELSGDHFYTKACEQKLKEITKVSQVLLTSSCTHALEMCALLLEIQPGDEVIMSSFNFVSAANAFILRGAKIVFVDIRMDTMNMDEDLIESAINNQTRAILVMHYGGVSCDMEKICAIGKKYSLPIIEDSAHCIGASYNNQHLGTFGDLGAISFHATKNVHCGEGGALLINNPIYAERAQTIRDKGTNRQSFIRNEVDKYSWVDLGSSYLMSELTAAFLYAQLMKLNFVNLARLALFEKYFDSLSSHFQCSLPYSKRLSHNAHIFYLLVNNRKKLISTLAVSGVSAYFHYTPLDSSVECQNHFSTSGSLKNTKSAGQDLLRLPIYPGLKYQDKIIELILKN